MLKQMILKFQLSGDANAENSVKPRIGETAVIISDKAALIEKETDKFFDLD